MSPISIVIDTNILLDIYVFQDPQGAALNTEILSGRLLPVASEQTNTEFLDVLARSKFGLSSDAQQTVFADWQRRSVVHDASQIGRAPWRCKDKDDQKFLDLAYSLRPCLLVSKDKQVLRFARRALREGVRIVSTSNLGV